MKPVALLKAASLGLALAATILTVGYGIALLRRPARRALRRPLFAGIDYERSVQTGPHPFTLHVVTVDLAFAGVEGLVVPGAPPPALHDREFFAQTTTSALERYQLQVAINGSFFYPFHAQHPLDFYPHVGDPVGALGQVVSNGMSYSPPQPGWPVLCIAQRASIAPERCPAGTQQAIAGRELVLQARRPQVSGEASDRERRYPRTAVGISEDGMTMWLIVIDGRQPFYSEGVTLAELGEIAFALGASAALNLDGGGSTTLAIADNGRPRLLNAPIHTRIPMRQRPIANHLGFYARPLDP